MPVSSNQILHTVYLHVSRLYGWLVEDLFSCSAVVRGWRRLYDERRYAENYHQVCRCEYHRFHARLIIRSRFGGLATWVDAATTGAGYAGSLAGWRRQTRAVTRSGLRPDPVGHHSVPASVRWVSTPSSTVFGGKTSVIICS